MKNKVICLFNDTIESASHKIIKSCVDNAHYKNEWSLDYRNSNGALRIEILEEKKEAPIPPPFSQNIKFFYINFVKNVDHVYMKYSFRFTYPFMIFLAISTIVLALGIVVMGACSLKSLRMGASEEVEVYTVGVMFFISLGVWLICYLLILRHRDKKRIEIFNKLILSKLS